ncbi:class I SAM-dependent methyltransferase [Streptomyces sp. TRM66268-LWL]|uniref:Class I SAM-dependent methyltransferase n=1 Tax=Streptomyces polyasparticus TaxID=2767826 RepID=A0ABR7SS03_9ACTN|nr:TylF/MycF/NovP-related O-methyltransferase [Streptomyces polyasparticus]MBC9718173.1 class I SAM-dependent methyltransferase [Streptomyces polyasparticus]
MKGELRVVSRPMAWKNAVNGALRTLTGYQLTRPQLPAPRTAQESAKAAAPKVKSKGLTLPVDYDEEAKETIRAVKPWTMTSPERLNAFILATRHVVKHGIPGDIVECGVWRGGSMQACAKTLLSCGVSDRDLYLFDTYEGMTEPTEEDLRRDGKSAADLLAVQGKDRPIWAVATLDDVKSGFEQVPYPAERVHYVQGKVEDTVPGEAPEQIAILRLDTDWYASTKHELDHLYERLVPGGVLLIDDYGYWQGSRQAVDEFLEKTGERLLLLRMDEGRIAVKP